MSSTEAILHVLSDFEKLSGLHASSTKSTLFITRCDVNLQRSISSRLCMPIGSMPVRYLGVPLTSKRLSLTDCMPLLEAITNKIHGWKSTSLSFAGRIELGKILFWCSSFLLPQKVISRINQLLARFLWSGQDKKGIHKVSWQDVCLPKNEGGLGFRSVSSLNSACLMRFIWAVASKKDSLWVKRVNGRYLPCEILSELCVYLSLALGVFVVS